MSIIYDSSNCWHRRTLIFGAQKQFDVIECNLQYFKTSIAQCGRLLVNKMHIFVSWVLTTTWAFVVVCGILSKMTWVTNIFTKYFVCILNWYVIYLTKQENGTCACIWISSIKCYLFADKDVHFRIFFQRPTYMCILIIWWKGWGVFSASIRDLLKTIIKE